jgi:hypothetical protein
MFLPWAMHNEKAICLVLIIFVHTVTGAPAHANLFFGHRQEAAITEREFRTRDDRINSQFRDAIRKKCNKELSMKQYSSSVKKLRQEELKLFSDVKKHKFTDETEYNYWHRGRMKFPGALARETAWLKKKQGPPPSDNLQW